MGGAPVTDARPRGSARGVEAAARRYLGIASATPSADGAPRTSGRRGHESGAASSTGVVEGEEEDEDVCSICQEGLTDASAREELGEPVETGCGHRFHAACYARVLETSSEREPLCPMCRAEAPALRFGME